jgi:putative ABC transport system permease protein
MVMKGATVVGIVDFMQHMPWSGPQAELSRTVVFVPALAPGPSVVYMVRTQPGRRDATMARVEKEIGEMQPGRYVASMEAFSDTVRRARAGQRTSVITLAVVALFVVAVTAVGIVGLAAFTVATRTKQLGTRRAIGATRFHILRYFLIENWLITSMGALMGCALALAVGIKLSEVYRMPRLPLMYLVGGVLVLWVLGLVAVWLPARRAAAISPAIATRTV